MKKCIFMGGCLLGVLSTLALPLVLMVLVIVLCISIASPGIALSFGPGTNQNTKQTQEWTAQKNDAVVNAARTLVQTLYPCGDNPQHYKCYTLNFPINVLE